MYVAPNQSLQGIFLNPLKGALGEGKFCWTCKTVVIIQGAVFIEQFISMETAYVPQLSYSSNLVNGKYLIMIVNFLYQIVKELI